MANKILDESLFPLFVEIANLPKNRAILNLNISVESGIGNDYVAMNLHGKTERDVELYVRDLEYESIIEQETKDTPYGYWLSSQINLTLQNGNELEEIIHQIDTKFLNSPLRIDVQLAKQIGEREKIYGRSFNYYSNSVNYPFYTSAFYHDIVNTYLVPKRLKLKMITELNKRSKQAVENWDFSYSDDEESKRKEAFKFWKDYWEVEAKKYES